MKMRKYINTKNLDKLSDQEKTSGNYILEKDVTVQVDNQDDLTATFIITTGNPDTDNDVIKPDGLDITAFQKNPVVLWQHNRDILPVGKCISISQIKNGSGGGAGGWIGTVQFMPKEIDENSYKIFQMIKSGFLGAVSIGFMVDDMENNSLGGYNILKSRLYEFSIVTVPANSECLVINNPATENAKSASHLATSPIVEKEQHSSDVQNSKPDTQPEPEFNVEKLIDQAVSDIDELSAEITAKIDEVCGDTKKISRIEIIKRQKLSELYKS